MTPTGPIATIDYAIVLVYATALLVVGAVIARHIRGFDDFFIAGARMTTPLLVCTLVSTYYGLDVLFGGSEVSYQEGVVAWFVYLRPYYFVILVAALLVAPRLRRYPFRSLPDAMGHFYGNGARAVAAVASFLYSLPFMALMGMGVLLDVVLGIPFAWGVLLGAVVSLVYTLLGGLPAAAVTDTFQFVLMCVTLGIAAILTLDGLGGLEGMQAELPASYFQPTGTYPPAVLVVFAASALSVLVEPAFYQRIFAARSTRAIFSALLLGIVLWASFDWIVTVLGMAAAAAGVEAQPTYALLTITLQALPVGLTGLFIAGVLATAMSTVDSYLLIAGGNLAYDLYRPLVRPEMGSRDLLRLTRWMATFAAVLAIVLALFFQTIVSAWIFISTLLTASVLVPLMAGLFSPAPVRPAAGFSSSLAGMGSAILFYVAVSIFGAYDAEWETVIWHLTVGELTLSIWQEYALFVALPASALAFVAGQLLSEGPGAGPPAPREPLRHADAEPRARGGRE
jgi:solute:Na+ symporter, SSS family